MSESTNANKEKSVVLSERMITLNDPEGVASEAYRTLRTSLLYSQVDDPPKVITITSPGQKEGKSTTSANISVVLAQAEKRTLLVDCDLRRPMVHSSFGVRNTSGLAEVLAGDAALEDLWFEPIDNLKVVTSGSIPPNPAELLGSRRFVELLGGIREQFDFVVLDAPPVQLVSDASIVATQSDGVLLVLDAQKTRKVAVKRSISTLEGVGARVLGTVMNKVKPDKSGGYYGYTYSYSGKEVQSN